MKEVPILYYSMRNRFGSIILASLAFLFFIGCKQKTEKEDRPNVLMIIVDDMADWVAAMQGHPDVKTPNIDRLAWQGIMFTNAHTTSPICGPARAALLTGLRPETTGVYTNIGTYIDYVPNALSLPRHFRNHGYHVMGAGKVNHGYTKIVDSNWDDYGPDTGIVGTPFTDEELQTENMDPTITITRDRLNVTLPFNRMSNIDRPYNKWSTFDWGPLDVEDEDMPDGRIANWGVEQIKKQYDKPFFMALGFYKPHLPWYAPKKYFDLFEGTDISLPPTKEGELEGLSQSARDFAHLAWTAGCHKTVLEFDQWKQAVLGYLATIAFVDAQIGKLLDALERSDYADNTLIVFFSDHGFHLGEKEHWGKHTPWQPATRVPFMIVPPKKILTGSVQRGMVSEAPVNLLDVFPTLIGFCQLPELSFLEGNSLYPLVLNPESTWKKATVSSIGRGTHSVHTREYRYIQHYEGSEELYHLKNDPHEWQNLSALPAYQPLMHELRAYIPEDTTVRHWVRWDKWKAIIRYNQPSMLFDIYEPNGISEQNNLADAHPEILDQIQKYIEDHQIENRRVDLSNLIQ
ncbi:MAG: sulfatase-like hydrolase/transferase [Cyclobacteriaceae bacterium]|nr:sulfatase-like hydrolase/transferase [Cyclobacteriaceae bacterium]